MDYFRRRLATGACRQSQPAAERLRVSSETVRQLCDAHKIVAIRISTKKNGHRKIVASSLDAYIESLCKEAAHDDDRFESIKPEFDPNTLRIDDVIQRARSAVKQKRAAT